MDTSSPEFQEALRDHARNLGVDPDAESYLLPLVQEALLAELPPDWEQGETEDGTLYYFNPNTEESIWEHPLDAHYRELIQTKKEEHAAETTEIAESADVTKIVPVSPVTESIETRAADDEPVGSTTTAINSVDVYSFDDISDEEAATPLAPAAPVSSKSRISDLFSTPTISMPARQSGDSTTSSVESTPVAIERPQTATPVATGFGFGRDRSWLLDNDDDVPPIPIKSALAPAQVIQKQETTATTAINFSSTTRLNSFSSRRSAALVSSTNTPTLSIPSPNNAAADVVAPLTPVTVSQTSPQNAVITSRRPGSIASSIKVPFFQDTPEQPGASSAVTSSLPSPGTIAKIQQLEKKFADANSDLEKERTAHAETTRQLQTAQQDAKESNYLKMKVNELKSKLADQESAASAREKQQLEKLVDQESAASTRDKQQAEKLAKLEAENARLVKQQGQTQSQLMEAHQKEAQQNREALDSKHTELNELQKWFAGQEQQAKAALETHEKAQTALKQKLAQQEASAEAARSQHVKVVATLREQLDKLEQQLRSSKSTADEQATKCEQLEKLQQELCTLKSKADEQTAKCEQLETVQQELRTLRSKADEQAAKCEQLTKLQQEMKGTSEEQAAKCHQLEAVQEALARQEKLRREAQEKNRELQAIADRAERDHADSNRKHANLIQELDAKKMEISTLQITLSKAQGEIRTLNSSFEQQRHQQQLTLERERITADAETQVQTRLQKLQTQLTAQLDEQVAARAKLQSEVLELRGELACMQAQELKPLEKLRDQLQRELERVSERNSTLEKELRTARQELTGQTDRAHQLEIEVDVYARREQQRKAQTDTLNTAKSTAEKQLAALQDELLTVQHDRRVDTDKLNFRVRELESQVSQKEYEAARLEERFNKAEAWRVQEAARVEKRDVQLLELREQLTALQARHVEVETSAEIQELRAAKQKVELRIQQLERELGDEHDARKRDEIRRTEELQRMQQAVEWQLPQLAQACVTRSSDEWARKCRAVAKKLRDELSLHALQERNEVVAREQQAREACERAEQKLKTAVAESEFLRREVSRLEDNNKVLLEQLHTIRVYLMQRPHASNMGSWNWPGNAQPPPSQTASAAAVGGSLGGASIPFGGFTDFSTVNQLNTQLGILHAQFQQLFEANDQRRRPSVTSFSPSDRFEIPSSPTASASRATSSGFHKEDQRREAEARRQEDEDAEIQRLAMDALMDQKLAACSSSHFDPPRAPKSLQRQQEELLTTLESLGDISDRQCVPVGSNTVVSVPDGVEVGHEPHNTMWYQQDYWRRKYQ